MTKTDLSTEALMARRKLAEQATPGPWQKSSAGRNIIGNINGRYLSHVAEASGVDATHIAASNPTTVIATIDDLVRLRAECARLEREAEWLALVLANACCGVPLSEYIDMDINCMSPPAPEHWRDAARRTLEMETDEQS